MSLWRWQHTKALPSGKTRTWGGTCENLRSCSKAREQNRSALEGSAVGCSGGQIPLSRLDYIPKRKSEHPQRGSGGRRWRDSETEKRESQPFDVKPVIFLRHPVLAPLSVSDTHRRKVIKIPHSLRSWLNPMLFSNLGFLTFRPTPRLPIIDVRWWWWWGGGGTN